MDNFIDLGDYIFSLFHGENRFTPRKVINNSALFKIKMLFNKKKPDLFPKAGLAVALRDLPHPLVQNQQKVVFKKNPASQLAGFLFIQFTVNHTANIR